MRCLTVADALKGRGAQCTFLMSETDVSLGAVSTRGHELEVFKGGRLPTRGPFESLDFYRHFDEDTDAIATLACCRERGWRPDVLVVDHYGLTSAWHRAFRAAFPTCRLVLVEDLGNRPMFGDVLIDQNDNPDVHSRYASFVNPECRMLFGVQYGFFLLKDSLAELRRRRAARGATLMSRLFVTMGGTDPNGFCWDILSALGSELEAWSRVDAIIGSNHSHHAQLEALAARVPSLILHESVPEPMEFADQASVSIGAGGVMAWERAFVGAPAILYAVSDNQLPTCLSLARCGAALSMGNRVEFDPVRLKTALENLRREPDILQKMSEAALALWPADVTALKDRLLKTFLHS